MLVELCRLCDDIEMDETIACVVLAATGDRYFCAGQTSMRGLIYSPQEFARYWVRSGHRVFDRIARLSKPTIAVLAGNAFGGGLELAACCDIRVMAPNALDCAARNLCRHRAGLVRHAAAGAAFARTCDQGNGAVRAQNFGGAGAGAWLCCGSLDRPAPRRRNHRRPVLRKHCAFGHRSCQIHDPRRCRAKTHLL